MIYLYLRVSICVVSTRKAIRFSMNYGTELKQVVHTHWPSCRSGWPRGFGDLNSWTSTSFSVDSSPRSYHLLPLRSERCQHSAFEFGAAQLRFVTELAPESPFLCVNKIPIWYDFRAGANLDIRYSVSIAQSYFIGLLLIQQTDVNVPWSILLSTIGLTSKSSKSWWEISWIYILW